MSAPIDICTAAAFSAVMRRYSAGVQVPWAIIRLRRKTVSQDAIVRRAIIIGRTKDEFRVGFLMPYEMSIRPAATSPALTCPVTSPSASECQAGPRQHPGARVLFGANKDSNGLGHADTIAGSLQP